MSLVQGPSVAIVTDAFVSMKLWDLLDGKPLFCAYGESKREDYDDQKQLARIAALIGPPPRGLRSRGKRSHEFYDSDGM